MIKRPDDKDVIVVVGMVLALLLCQLLTLSRQILPYMLGVIIVTFLIYASIHYIHGKTALKCPKCGQGLQDVGYKIVFKGAQNRDGGRDFPAIAIRYLQCPQCEDVQFQEFDFPISSSKGDFSSLDMHYQAIDPQMVKAYYGGEMPKGVNFKPTPQMTEYEYQWLREKLKREVQQHNRRTGFI